MSETFKKVDDGLEVTRVRVVTEERLTKQLRQKEEYLEKLKTQIVVLKAKLEAFK